MRAGLEKSQVTWLYFIGSDAQLPSASNTVNPSGPAWCGGCRAAEWTTEETTTRVSVHISAQFDRNSVRELVESHPERTLSNVPQSPPTEADIRTQIFPVVPTLDNKSHANILGMPFVIPDLERQGALESLKDDAGFQTHLVLWTPGGNRQLHMRHR